MSVKKRVLSRTCRATSRAARMVGGAAAAVCPPGVWCMDTGMLVVAIVLVGVLAFIGFQIYKQRQIPAVPQKPTVVVVTTPTPTVVQSAPLIPADPRFNPLSPERSYETPPDLRGFPTPPISAGMGAIPINIPTRGVPDQYQQVGVLTAPGGTETSGTPTRTILPLFGRKLITNRDRWNYYTRTDGMNPVQVPLEFKRRKCDDDVGCDEITEGDTVSVPIMGQSYVANVYRYSVPRYLPQ
jgi:hypothetical protein